MTDYQPKVGDRIDLTLRNAEVIDTNARGTGGLRVRHDGAYLPDLAYFSAKNSPEIEVEVVEPAKPRWVAGDVVTVRGLDGDDGFTLVRLDSGGWVCSQAPGVEGWHRHPDAGVDRFFDSGRATAIIAGGEVVTQ